MTALLPLCWICGNPATSSEHKAKRSDLRDVFGVVSQADPIYYRDDTRGQRTIGSLDAKVTKFPDKICTTCNNSRTQPHDLAWESFSGALHDRRLASGAYIRANRIFRYDTARKMLAMHLYFVKQFGCLIQEGRAPIDLSPFAASIMNNRAHPGVFLKFGIGPTIPGNSLVARSKLRIDSRADGSVAHASWIYNVDGVAAQITFAERGMQHGFGWWHPSLGSNRLLIGDMAS